MLKHIKPLTIGIIGGGQLGRMTAHAAQALGYKTIIFADKIDSPAIQVTDSSIIANYDDKKALQKFADLIDVATFEFENIPVASVEFLNAIKPVYPSAQVLKITQHRILEKSFLNKIGIATAEFAEIKTLENLLDGLKKFGKAVLKTATMGYDGKGQFVLENEASAQDAWTKILQNSATETSSLNAGNFSAKNNLPPLILEKFCSFTSEISVIVARSINGEIACYEPLTNVHKNGILDSSTYPAKISAATKNTAEEIATKIVQSLDLKGVLAVEFFVMNDGSLLVNELAPRPHNSGHFSMDAAITSQFEQLARAITGLPLGSTKFHSQGFMKNLIGDEVNNLGDFLIDKNSKIHLYGKLEAKAGRKMGHINILKNHP